jgi:hypothetical protein
MWGYRIARLDFSLAFAFTRHGAEFCPQHVYGIFLWITLSISLYKYKYDHPLPQILPTSRTGRFGAFCAVGADGAQLQRGCLAYETQLTA